MDPATQQFQQHPDTLVRHSLTQSVLLPSGTDEPLVLGGAAVRIWDMLEEPTSLGQLADDLGLMFSRDPALIVEEIGPVLDSLVQTGAAVAVTPDR